MSVVQTPAGTSLRLGRMADTFCLSRSLCSLYIRRNPARQFFGAYAHYSSGVPNSLFPPPSSAHFGMLASASIVSLPVPKYLVAFWRTSRLFRSVPSFCASIRRKISDAVLAGNVSAGELLFLADAGLPATFGKSPVRIIVYIKNIPKRILPLQKQSRPNGRLCAVFSCSGLPRALCRGAASHLRRRPPRRLSRLRLRSAIFPSEEERNCLSLSSKDWSPEGGSGCCARGAAWG